MKRTDLVNQLVRATLELGPTTAQGNWRQAECPACAAVNGLRTLQHNLLLPSDVTISMPDSPIVEIDQAHELYRKVMPGVEDARLLRPLLIRLMYVNDAAESTRGQRFNALWGIFASAEAFHDLRPRNLDVPSCQIDNTSQARLGNTELYIRSSCGIPDQILSRSWFAAAKKKKVSRALLARERDPAQWRDDHEQRFGSWQDADARVADNACAAC